MIKTPYIIALYVRLSVEDCKVDSFSVENQKIALHQYVDTVESFEGAEVQEFTDNGFSGTITSVAKDRKVPSGGKSRTREADDAAIFA